ncbi:hypothetical protein D3C80_1531220 [compost metagenome]
MDATGFPVTADTLAAPFPCVLRLIGTPGGVTAWAGTGDTLTGLTAGTDKSCVAAAGRLFLESTVITLNITAIASNPRMIIRRIRVLLLPFIFSTSSILLA